LNTEKKKQNEEAAAASKKLVNNALKKVKLNAEKKKRNEEAAANALKKVKLNAEKNRLKNLVKKSKLNTNPFWAIEINALTNVNKGKNIEKKIKKPIYESNEENNNKFKTKIYNNPMFSAKNNVKRATLTNKSSYQAKINSQYFKLPRNRKKVYTSRIQKATTLGQVLKAYNNAEKERTANLKK
jgi:hypothetical protein